MKTTLVIDTTKAFTASVSTIPQFELGEQHTLRIEATGLDTGCKLGLAAYTLAGDPLFAVHDMAWETGFAEATFGTSTVQAVAALGERQRMEIIVGVDEYTGTAPNQTRKTIAQFKTILYRDSYAGSENPETIEQAVAAVATATAQAVIATAAAATATAAVDTMTGQVAVEAATRLAADEQLYDTIALLTGNAQRFITNNSVAILGGVSTYESIANNPGGSTVTLTIASADHIYWRGIAAVSAGTTPSQTINLRIVANEVVSGAFRGDMRLSIRMGVYDSSAGTVSWVSSYGTEVAVPEAASPVLIPTLIPELTADVGDVLIVDLACTLAEGGTARSVALKIEDDTLSAWAFNPGTVSVSVSSKMDKIVAPEGNFVLANDPTGNAKPTTVTEGTLEANLPSAALAKLISAASSSCRLFGGEIANLSGAYILVAAGGGVSKSGTATLQDIPHVIGDGQSSAVEYVEWDAIEIPLQDGYNLVYWDASAGAITSCLREDMASVFDFTRDFTVGSGYYDATAWTKVFRLCGMDGWNFPRRVQMFGEERFPVERASGLMIGNPSELHISLTAGVIWTELVNRFPINGFDSRFTDKFTTWAREAKEGEPETWYSISEVEQIDAINYNNHFVAGGLSELTANRYGVHWIYVVHDSSVHVVYGTGNYTLAQAQNATPPTILPGLIAAYATLVGKAIVKKNASTLTSLQSPFVTSLGLATVNEHNDLVGPQGGAAGEYYHLTSAQVSAVNGAVRHDTAQALSAAAKAQACANVGLAAPVAMPYPEVATVANNTITATSAKFLCSSAGVSAGVMFSFKDRYSGGNASYPTYAEVFAQLNGVADNDTFTLTLSRDGTSVMAVTVTRVSATSYTIGSVTVSGSPAPMRIAFTNEGTTGNYTSKLYVNGTLAATSNASANRANRIAVETASLNSYAWAAYLPHLNYWTTGI